MVYLEFLVASPDLQYSVVHKSVVGSGRKIYLDAFCLNEPRNYYVRDAQITTENLSGIHGSSGREKFVFFYVKKKKHSPFVVFYLVFGFGVWFSVYLCFVFYVVCVCVVLCVCVCVCVCVCMCVCCMC